MEIPNFRTWSNLYDKIISYDYNEDRYIISQLPPSNINSFYLTKNYINSKEQSEPTTFKAYLKVQLKEYAYKLVEDRNQLLEYPGLRITYDYFDNNYKKKDGTIYYRSHTDNIVSFFKRLCKDKTTHEIKYTDYEDIQFKEYHWFTKCNNGGLTFLDPSYKGKTVNTYGYDFVMSYPTDMASVAFKIPTKAGRFTNVDILSLQTKTIKYGIYRCKITSKDPYFNMLFSYSKEHYYTHYSLMFVLSYMKTQERQKTIHSALYDVKIEPVECKFNALIYDETVTGVQLFGNWFKVMQQMKQDLKGNSIIKLLSSSLWGHLNESKKVYIRDEEFDDWYEAGYTFSYDIDDWDQVDYIILEKEPLEDGHRYRLLDTAQKIYKHNLRLMPFITSFSRYKMQKLISKNKWHDKIIRIATDSINFITKPTEKLPDNFKLDDKITGKIHYEHLNKYSKVVDA